MICVTRTLCVPEAVGVSIVGNSVSECSFVKMGTRGRHKSGRFRSKGLPLREGREHMGILMSQEPGWTPSVGVRRG